MRTLSGAVSCNAVFWGKRAVREREGAALAELAFHREGKSGGGGGETVPVLGVVSVVKKGDRVLK